ncbi:acyltransferase family-domain-containing protein [Dactylonectria estremocensis]|uniref:Acyltransferase family-domain-containing protein n=1 Tax=Dactylonectria estremocensis TaxID=1079267 RepID=A0A9P9ELP8_9HYPO|nr:acyltransferase family-domain-containing protein [Dactylonectria estremocensis]
MHSASGSPPADGNPTHADSVSVSGSGSDDDFNPRQLLVRSADRILSWVEYAKSSPGQLLMRIAWFLVPSFLQGRAADEKAQLGPTAYLDGMRGVAALVVFFCHTGLQAYSPAFGWGCGGGYYGLLRLPILRLLYAGDASVALFFVISGYAISYKPVRMIRSRSTHEFGAVMSSMVFRRGLRLYLPTIASTGLVVIFLRLGFYEPTRAFAKDPTYFRHLVMTHRTRLDSGLEQWMDWASNVFRSLALFHWESNPRPKNEYDNVTWTIPVEYRCSLYLFLIHIGTSRLKTHYRIITLMLFTCITYRKARWEFLLFLYGLACVEWDYARGAHTRVLTAALPQNERGKSEGSQLPLKAITWNLVSILALYLLSQPSHRRAETPGWVTLDSMIPEYWDNDRKRYWQGFGAGLFLLSVGHSAFWQRIFTADAVQYLGKISYALYLVHSRLTRWLQFILLRFVFFYLTGAEGDNYYRGFWLGTCLVIPVVIWCADVFWRAVDIPIVKFSKWVEKKLVAKDA